MTTTGSPYAGRVVALATRHGKEQVIARPLRHGLGASLLHLDAIDTDALGSFCGRVERRGTAQQACLAKAQRALEVGGTGLAIASEGSFGPHPAVPLLAVGQECMVFLDGERGLTIREELLARRTNFSQHRIAVPPAPASDLQPELERWLRQVGFPGHAVLVRSLPPEDSQLPPDFPPNPFQAGAEAVVPWPAERADAADEGLIKGIRDPASLLAAIRRLGARSPLGRVQLETDMRAHCNPTRMASIRQLAFRLVRRIASPCPGCGSPGWGRIGAEVGLPCGWCGLATELIRAEVMGCPVCGLRCEQPRRDGLLRADPGHCLHCNP